MMERVRFEYDVFTVLRLTREEVTRLSAYCDNHYDHAVRALSKPGVARLRVDPRRPGEGQGQGLPRNGEEARGPHRPGALQKRLDEHLATLRAGKDSPDLLAHVRGLLGPILEKGMIDKFRKSWSMSDRAERKSRLDAVTKLAIELAKIKQQTIQATSLAEQVLEDIIEGDWDAAARFVEHFTFSDEDEHMRSTYGPIYENFVLVGRTVCAENARREPHEKAKPH